MKASQPKLLNNLAAIAKIPELAKAHFCERVNGANAAAYKEREVKNLRLFNTSQIVTPLVCLAKYASKLSTLLARVATSRSLEQVVIHSEKISNLLAQTNVDRSSELPAANIAGGFLRAALIELGRDADDDLVRLAALLTAVATGGRDAKTEFPLLACLLGVFARAAEQGAVEARFARGRQAGAPGYLPFELFVVRLLLAVRGCGGSLTVYRKEELEAGWAGSLLEAVRIIEPCLPDRFVPVVDPYNTLFRIASRLRRAGLLPKARSSRS